MHIPKKNNEKKNVYKKLVKCIFHSSHKIYQKNLKSEDEKNGVIYSIEVGLKIINVIYHNLLITFNIIFFHQTE